MRVVVTFDLTDAEVEAVKNIMSTEGVDHPGEWLAERMRAEGSRLVERCVEGTFALKWNGVERRRGEDRRQKW